MTAHTYTAFPRPPSLLLLLHPAYKNIGASNQLAPPVLPCVYRSRRIATPSSLAYGSQACAASVSCNRKAAYTGGFPPVVGRCSHPHFLYCKQGALYPSPAHN